MQNEPIMSSRGSLGDASVVAQEASVNDQPTSAEVMVPMLDWPTDLFKTFTVQYDDDAAYPHA
jgi:hypothetical protein